MLSRARDTARKRCRPIRHLALQEDSKPRGRCRPTPGGTRLALLQLPLECPRLQPHEELVIQHERRTVQTPKCLDVRDSFSKLTLLFQRRNRNLYTLKC